MALKILTVLGARPQFIKAAVVSREITRHNLTKSGLRIVEKIVHTGQHYDANMSDVFFKEMKIPKPDYYLDVNGGSHGVMTGRMLEKIEQVILKEKPDIVLVYGDTNSTLAGALAAVKLHIPVAHVEAGLRSFNRYMPEEINRILTDRVSTWLFCPTETAVMNLEKEGFVTNTVQVKVSNVGDVMYDAALFYKQVAHPTETVMSLLQQLKGGFYLATVHRAENTEAAVNLNNIINSLDIISKKVPVVFPLHPRTKSYLQQLAKMPEHIMFVEPVSYFDMLSLLSRCSAVFTDSGGVQKEAYFFKKPCITLRNETEWVELVEEGLNILVGPDPEKILAAERSVKTIKQDYCKSLYGAGDAGKKIIKILVNEKKNKF